MRVQNPITCGLRGASVAGGAWVQMLLNRQNKFVVVSLSCLARRNSLTVLCVNSRRSTTPMERRC